jgi:hypothetical protein
MRRLMSGVAFGWARPVASRCRGASECRLPDEHIEDGRATLRVRVSEQLYWSKHGEVACEQHAPRRDSDRWSGERWAAIPLNAGKGRIHYQCQCCASRPIDHRQRPVTPDRGDDH